MRKPRFSVFQQFAQEHTASKEQRLQNPSVFLQLSTVWPQAPPKGAVGPAAASSMETAWAWARRKCSWKPWGMKVTPEDDRVLGTKRQ